MWGGGGEGVYYIFTCTQLNKCVPDCCLQVISSDADSFVTGSTLYLKMGEGLLGPLRSGLFASSV